MLIAYLLFIIGCAILSSGSAAIAHINEQAARQLSEEGDRAAARLYKHIQHADALSRRAHIGIGLLAIAMGAFCAGPLGLALGREIAGSGDISHPAAVTAILIGMVAAMWLVLGVLFAILGVLLPDRIGTIKPLRTARHVLGPFLVIASLFAPFVTIGDAVSLVLARIFGVDPHSSSEAVTEEEILHMVDIGEEKGAIEAGEKEMIENIFEFNNLTAADAMTHRTDIEAIQIEDDDRDIVALIQSTGLSRFPVYREDLDDIIGVVSTREYLLNATLEHPKPLADILRPPFFVPESVATDVLFREMQVKKNHMAIVIDEYGGTSGLITLEDLLEEIVGNIYDEFDPESHDEDIIPIGENTWRVSGNVDLDTLSETLDIALPEDEEYDTLGGLIFSQLSVIPKDGSRPQVEAYGLKITVEQLLDRRVEWAVVEKLPQQTPPESEEEKDHE
nr:hemolysin family protein [bacterium]